MSLAEIDSKERFNSRVENYSKYRPSYPNEIIGFLQGVIGLTKKSIIADIGSGTGISTKMFLDNGNIVYAVEPNQEMRQAAENLLKGYSEFHSIDGSSENTKLESESIDIITAAQAFHWFEPEAAKKEFLRILKPSGSVVLMWNIRKRKSDGFMGEYFNILTKYGERLNVKSDEEVMPKFFDSRIVHKEVFANPQVYDFDRLKGELASYSYMPNKNHPDYIPMMSDVEGLFNKYNNNGKVVLEYDTQLYYCRMK